MSLPVHVEGGGGRLGQVYRENWHLKYTLKRKKKHTAGGGVSLYVWHISGSCCEQYFYLTHMLRLICQFGRADDAVYPSGLKVACFRLFVPSKLAVVLFAGTAASFHKVIKALKILMGTAWFTNLSLQIGRLSVRKAFIQSAHMEQSDLCLHYFEFWFVFV